MTDKGLKPESSKAPKIENIREKESPSKKESPARDHSAKQSGAKPSPHEDVTGEGGHETKPICLALQGGGAFGAFEWGVLDALLEDGRLRPMAVSGASAGAMNASVLGYGLAVGGVAGARKALGDFWRAISESGGQNPLGGFEFWKNSFNNLFGGTNFFTKMAQGFSDSLGSGQSMGLSPYQFNPLNLNPLRDVLNKVVDFALLQRQCPIKLFIAATEVQEGRLKIFEEKELTVDHILASACLPYLFQAVNIGTKAYWDGGYLANPPLWPLFYNNLPRDIMIVNLNPLTRKVVPHDGSEIIDRLNEISFNATLLSELRAAAFVNRLIDEDLLNEKGKAKYLPVRLHMIGANKWLDDQPASAKFKTDWSFLTDLYEKGREAAKEELKKSYGCIGHVSSLDVYNELL